MRLLFVCPGLPYPPRKGAAMRTWAFLRYLARQHEVSVAAFAEAAPEPPLSELCARVVTVPAPGRDYGRRLLTVLASPKPDLAWRLRSARFQSALDGLLAAHRFDAVVYESLEMAPFRRPIGGAAAVLDELNAEYVLQRRAWLNDARVPARWPASAYSLLQWVKLRRWEAAVCRRFDRVVAVSEVDAEALAVLAGRRPAVVTNGVDVAEYDAARALRLAAGYQPAPGPTEWTGPDAARAGTSRPAAASEGAPAASLLFVGTLDYRPNVDAAVWFARSILPRVRAVRPAARFDIVGASPAPAVRALADLPGVRLAGPVPDVRPYLAAAAVYVVPMRIGGGVRLKLLEAMAAGVPLVTTTTGAEGVDLPPDAAGIADGVEAFAEAVIARLGCPELGARQAAVAHRFVAEHYDWSAIVPRLEAVLADTAARRRGRAR